MNLPKRVFFCSFFILLITTWLPAYTHATTAIFLSNQELAQNADFIVRGLVKSQRIYWGDGHKTVYTDSKVEVKEYIKPIGSDQKPQKEILINQIGGKVGDIIYNVLGDAKLKPGEEVILFLKKDQEKSRFYLLALCQAKFTVIRKEGASPVIFRNLEELTLAKMVKGKVQILQHSLHRVKHQELKPTIRPLADFVKEINSYLLTQPKLQKVKLKTLKDRIIQIKP